MQDFKGPQDVRGPQSGHNHFFAAFDKFGAATSHKGAMLAEDAQRAAAEHEFYLETMLSRQSGAVAALAKQVGFDADLSQLRARLLEGGAMDTIVAAARADTDTDFAQYLRGLYPGAHISLHAGELVPGLASPAPATS
ncbi:MAG: hypothetical protein ACRDRS_12980 [Pseudonocardiaceae bacterium]